MTNRDTLSASSEYIHDRALIDPQWNAPIATPWPRNDGEYVTNLHAWYLDGWGLSSDYLHTVKGVAEAAFIDDSSTQSKIEKQAWMDVIDSTPISYGSNDRFPGVHDVTLPGYLESQNRDIDQFADYFAGRSLRHFLNDSREQHNA